MQPLDARIHPFRPDMAAAHLKGVVAAPLYVPGSCKIALKGVVSMRKNPSHKAEQVNELRHGDAFTVYEDRDGWSWGQTARDDYVGYVASEALGVPGSAPTHRVRRFSSFVFSEPSIRAPVTDRLTYFTAVTAKGAVPQTPFLALADGGYMHAHHLVPLAEWDERECVTIAGQFLGIPYLWGGVTPLGFDCSGFVQLALNAAGYACPRDSDMQAAQLGRVVTEEKRNRGDLVFFPGHVGLMADTTHLLHANAHHGCVVVEPLTDVVARGSVITAVRRCDKI